ncbi:peptidase M14 [candidate division KSB1 bacterium]|nr:peptidase M14 [candidate division KSB1 bacterium]
MKTKLFVYIALFPILLSGQTTSKEITSSALKAIGAPNNPRVEIAWNRYYDYSELIELSRRLVKAFPKLIRMQSIGKSVKGNDLWALIVTNTDAGPAEEKPAMYIDGNIHSNEIQGAEVALYTVWYLAENYGQNEWITSLLDRTTFYVIPTINPDARDYFIHQGNTPHSPRTGLAPRDDDGDGLLDEDGLDDLDGDGFIVQMRRKNPHGRWLTDPDDKRMMIHAKPDQPGEFELLGWEGFDNDDDGYVNEDGPGFYDPNRNWGWKWEPASLQWGADRYPFSIPENRAVADFILAHKNIAAAQSYHNSGGMIIRGPGNEEDAKTYHPQDLQVYDFLGHTGQEILPGYDYFVLYRDMYTVYGGELDWFYGACGIYTFSNELWTPFNMFRSKNEDWSSRTKDVYRFDRLLLFKEGIVDWKPVDHPQFGRIEVGGVKKSWTRTAPSFLIEEMCHRNMAFTLLNAFHLPELAIDSVRIKKQGVYFQVDAVISNKRIIPTRSQHDVSNRISRPDYVSIVGPNNVIAGFVVTDDLLDLSTEQRYRPEKIEIDAVPGMGTVHVRWLVEGKPPFNIRVDAQRGGIVSRDIL